LLGYRRTVLQLNFANVNDLLAVRKVVMPIAEKNKKKVNAMDTYAEVARRVFPFVLEYWGKANEIAARTPALIFLTKTKITINDLMAP
jgi:hypothetical protein